MADQATDDAASRRDALKTALARVAEGDRAALRDIYDDTCDKMFGICLRVAKDREAAKDVLQEVYVKVWRRAGRYDPAKASPITWIAAIARNSAIDSLRRRRPPEVSDEQAFIEATDPDPDAEARAIASDESARIEDCLQELDGKHAQCIREAFFDGLTHSQLAKHQAVPLGTLKSWIRRGLARLKECLDG